MQAAVYHGHGDLRVEHVPAPQAGPGEVVIAVRRCGVCGTDVHIVSGAFPVPGLPLVIGHEFAGEVVEAGDGVTHVRPGDRVTADINIACGTCFHCRRNQKLFCTEIRQLGVHTHGAMAELVLAPAANVFRLPDGMSFADAAYVEPLSCAIHGQQRVGVGFGDIVAVLGAGAMGLAHVVLSRLAGATMVVVSEPSARRRELARQVGADVVVDPRSQDAAGVVAEVTEGRGADVVIEAAGVTATYELALRTVRAGGRLLAFGAPPATASIRLRPFEVFAKELTIVGSYASAYETWPKAIDLIASGRFDPALFVDSVQPLPSLARAMHHLGEDPSLVKTQIEMNGRTS